MEQSVPTSSETAGDAVKATVDKGIASGLRKLWKAAQEVGASAFFKGALLTGVLFVAAIGLLGGYMGADSSLAVGNTVMNTFEKGMGAGISKALEFLTSGIGLVSMAVGGTVFTGAQIIRNQHTQAALESERLAMEYQRSREQQKQQSQGQEHHHKHKHHKHGHHEHEHHKHDHHKPEQTVLRGGLDEDGIYVKGSAVKNASFSAAELKRRTERESMMGGREA